MRSLRAVVVAAGAGLLLAAPLSAQVLIVNGSSSTSETETTASITNQLQTLHTAVGNAVTVVNTRPADLTPYKQVWDIRFSNSSPLTGDDISAYLGFLQGGGGMFVMGENSSFMTRNNSVFSLISQAGGGSIGFGTGGSFQTVCSPFTGPNAVGTIGYAAPGYFDGLGTGSWIGGPSCSAASGGSGIAFGKGTLANATNGALTTILDVNFMQTDAGADAQALTRNLIGYVGNQVSTTPEPSSIVLAASGLLMVAGVAARRRRATS